MSSDAFADLGRSLSKFAEGLRRLMDANQRPTAGSPADKEADGEPYAGGWGLHPASAVFATVLLTTWSCTDHLSAAGTVLEHHRGISSLGGEHLNGGLNVTARRDHDSGPTAT